MELPLHLTFALGLLGMLGARQPGAAEDRTIAAVEAARGEITRDAKRP
jgi:hypothetical protein